VSVLEHVLATLAAVIAAGLLLGRLLRPLGQPPVVGEVLAGILLGPSLLGLVWPEAMHALIPAPADDPGGKVPAAVGTVAQLGVVLYMFLVGLELDAGHLAGHAKTAGAVAAVGMAVPFALGVGLAFGLYAGYSPAGKPFGPFALFLGVALAVTAFPVLARILADRGLDHTEPGTLALGAAAIGDVAAWCLLAGVVGVAKATVENALWVVGGAAAFGLGLVFVARPVLVRLSRWLDDRPGPLPGWAVSGTFVGVLLCSLATEAIGVHALFGAFLLGAVLPHDGRLAREFTTKLQVPVTVLLLPAFFAATGLRTEIGLLRSGTDWLWCGLVVLAATAGKVGGTVLAARLSRRGWRESLALGALMNTRGLMELIVLTVGLELGVISPPLFAMLVIMALVTTAATGPALAWLGVRGDDKKAA
jgi:Kef-type K+ transport system membrane component KefB